MAMRRLRRVERSGRETGSVTLCHIATVSSGWVFCVSRTGSLRLRPPGVHRSVNAARTSACATGQRAASLQRSRCAGVLVQDTAESAFLEILGCEVFVRLQNAIVGREELGSFCNLCARGEGWRYLHERRRECKGKRGVRLQG